MATPIYFTGFEHGTTLVAGVGNGLAITRNGSGTDAVTALAARTGGFGLRLTALGSGIQREVNFVAPNAQIVVGSFYWRAIDKPTTQQRDVCYTNVGGGFLGFMFDSAVNQLVAFAIGGTTGQQAQSSGTVTLNQWYRIDFRFTTNGASWTTEWKLDGITQTTATSTGNAATNMTTFYLDANDFGSADAHGCVWDYDDLILSTTTGDFPLGEHQIEGITADQSAAAAHQTITTTQWDTTTNFSTFTPFTGQTETTSRGLIDDLATADGIRMNATTPAGNCRWPVANPSLSGFPVAVSLVTVSREASTGVNNCTLRTLVGASTTTHFTGDPGWGTTFNYLRTIMTAKPGGGAWTLSDVQGINFEMLGTDGSPPIWLGGFYYEVAWKPPYVKTGYGKENG